MRTPLYGISTSCYAKVISLLLLLVTRTLSAQPVSEVQQPTTTRPRRWGAEFYRPFVLTRMMGGVGAISPLGQPVSASGNLAVDVGFRLLRDDLASQSSAVDFSAYLSMGVAAPSTSSPSLGLSASIGVMVIPMFSISYSPGFILGFVRNSAVGVGMRNAIQIGTLSDFIGLEIGYQFVGYEAGIEHSFRTVAWIDVGFAFHFLGILLAGGRPPPPPQMQPVQTVQTGQPGQTTQPPSPQAEPATPVQPAGPNKTN